MSTLRSIFERSGLNRADGRPLYAYRVTDAELEQMRRELALAASGRGLETSDGPAFCLLASAWFCRHHKSGAWRWEPILDAVDHPGPYTELYPLVERGLRFFRRDLYVMGSGRAFLVTLACEGGLPQHLIIAEGAHLRRYLKRLLQARETFAETDTIELAERYAGYLPGWGNQPLIWRLAGDLIDAIVELRRCLNEGDPNPIGSLDSCSPGWRSRVPLRLEEAAATELLNGLLRQPAVLEDTDLLCVQTLLLTRGDPRVVRLGHAPPRLAKLALARQLHMGAEDLPSLLHLSLEQSNGVRTPFCQATRSGAGEHYRTRPYRSRSFTEAIALNAPVRLVASTGDRDVVSVDVRGGGPLSDLIWCFRDLQDSHQLPLIADGPTRTRDSALILAYPADATVEVLEGSYEILGTVRPTGRVLARLQGEAIIDSDGETQRFQTRAAHPQVCTYFLSGRRLRFGEGGSEIWLGMPRVDRAIDELEGAPSGEPLVVEWRSASRPQPPGGGWSRDRHACVGDVQIRAVVDGDARFRNRVTVLPAGTSARMATGPGSTRGTLFVDGLPVDDATLLDDAITMTRTFTPGGSRLDFTACTHEPPRHAPLALRIGDAELTVLTAIPIAARRLISGGGTVWPRGETVHLYKLLGAIAEAYSPTRDRFLLEGHTRSARFHLELPMRGEGTYRLNLDRAFPLVEVLIACSRSRDAKVELEITRLGEYSEFDAPRISVTRHDGALWLDALEDGVALTLKRDEPGTARPDELRLEARPLLQPEDEPEVLVHQDGGWTFRHEGRAPGPWLITAWVGSMCRLRPLLVTVPGESPPVPTDVDRAMLIHKEAERFEALDGALEGLRKSFGDPGWERLSAFLATLRMLPPTTFDVVRRLPQHPDVVAMAALMAEEWFQDFWLRLERLPFFWALLPVRSWGHAFRRLREHSQARAERVQMPELADEIADRYIDRLLSRAVPESAAMRLIWESCLQHAGFTRTVKEPLVAMAMTEPGRAALLGLLEPNKTKVAQLHADDTCWPEADLWTQAREAGVPHELLRATWIDEHTYRKTIINAPVVTACLSVAGVGMEPSLVLQLRALRCFDETWFDDTYPYALAIALGAQLQRDPEYLS